MCPAHMIRTKRPINSASRVRYAQKPHYRVDHLPAWKDYLRTEIDYSYMLGKTIYMIYGLSTIYSLKKTIYSWRLFLQNS